MVVGRLMLLLEAISVFSFVLLHGMPTVRVCPPTSLEFTNSEFVQFNTPCRGFFLAAKLHVKRGLLGRDVVHGEVWTLWCDGC